MLHRDVSVSNIMYEEKDGKYYFRLIDFDMAKILPTEGNESTYEASSKHRTGTLPFMSHELVMDAYVSTLRDRVWVPRMHFLRDDWTSLFFVSVWLLLVEVKDGLTKREYEELVERAQAMESGKTLELVADHKRTLCQVPLMDVKGLVFPPGANCLKKWLAGWSELFAESLFAETKYKNAITMEKTPPPWDEETAGGIFTREGLKDMLTPLMPFKQEEPEGWDKPFFSLYAVDPSLLMPDGQPDQTRLPAVRRKAPKVKKRIAQAAAAVATHVLAASPSSERPVASTRRKGPARTTRAKNISSRGSADDLAITSEIDHGRSRGHRARMRLQRQAAAAVANIRSRLRVRKPVVYKQ